MSAKRFGYRRSRNSTASGPSTISLPSVETSMTPSESCTARTSPSGSPYANGRRPAPVPCPHPRRPRLLVAMVDRGALRRFVMSAREQAELDRRPGRACGRRADRSLVALGLLGIQPDRGQMAELALTGAHRHRRVALGELDRVEALAQGSAGG